MLKKPTLNIKYLPGGTIALASLIFSLILVLTEGVFRLLITTQVIPIPYLSTSNPEFNIKVQMLDAMAAQGQEIDCIFLGSSQFDNGVNPQIFTQAYHERTGKNIQCYNFSLATLTAAPAGEFARILAARYQPDLIVYGTSARDYSEEFGGLTRPVLEDPWVVFQMGKFTLRGALLEYSLAFRWLVSYEQIQDESYRGYLETTRNSITSTGMVPKEGSEFKESDGVAVPGFEFSEEDLAGLERILALNNSQTSVIIVEMPVHLHFLPHYVGDSEKSYTSEFLGPIARMVEDRDVPFWRTTYIINDLVPRSGWFDLKHLNAAGAELFSRWMAENLAAAISEGNLTDPFK